MLAVMGNVACVSASSSGESDVQQHPVAPLSMEEGVGFDDLPLANDDLGLTQLFRTPSEEAAQLQQQQQQPKSKIASWLGFGGNKKASKTAALKPAAAQAKAAAPSKPVFVDDRKRFGLGPLTALNDETQLRLAAMSLPALLVRMGQLAGVRSVRAAKVEREVARIKAEFDKVQAALRAIDEADEALVKAVAAPVCASVSSVAPPAPAVECVLGEGAPEAPALESGVVFGSVAGGWKNAASNKASSTYWAKGTGFGYHGAAGAWDVDTYLREQEKSLQELRFVMRKTSDKFEARVAEAQVEALAESTLVPVLESYLRNDSSAEILEQQAGLYSDVFSLVAHMLAMDAPQPSRLLGLLESSAPLLRKIARTAAQVEALDGKTPQAIAAEAERSASSSCSSSSSSSSSSASLSSASAPSTAATQTAFVIELSAILDAALAQRAAVMAPTTPAAEEKKENDEAKPAEVAASSSSVAAADESAARSALVTAYSAALSPLKFGEVEAFSGVHKYQKANASNGSNSAPISRAFTRRLAVEYADLNESLPVHLDSGCWMRVHETNMQYAQLLIAGPAGTPYSSGLFLFDVYFPPTYPQTPPQVNLCTTGRAAVRFNPNLYNCGKVCLSILGTWGGGVGEGWSPASSTMLQVAVSIQSLVMVPEPYFNEPSYESTMGTPDGQRQSADYSKPLYAATIRWAMLDQMKTPPAGFESIVRAHFALKRDEIKRQVAAWAKINPQEINDAMIKELSDALDQQKVDETAAQ